MEQSKVECESENLRKLFQKRNQTTKHKTLFGVQQCGADNSESPQTFGISSNITKGH